MIYLIGGSPRSGKTTLAKTLSKKLDIPYISTDYLRLVVMPYFKESQEKDFPFEKMFNELGINKFFEQCSGDEMLNADLTESHVLWPGIMGYLDHLLLFDNDYIFEGTHLLPLFLEKFIENKSVKSIILTKSNTDKIFEGFLASKDKGNDDWIADNIDGDTALYNIDGDTALYNAAKSLSKYGIYFEAESKKYKIRQINTEEDFYNSLKFAETIIQE